MELALSVHRSLLESGGPLSEAVSFEVADIASLQKVVEIHLSNGDLLTRGKLNSYLVQYKQERKLVCVKAIGFCFVKLAYHTLLDKSPHLFPSASEFLAKYPEYAHFPTSEQLHLHFMCKTMIAALTILDGKNNKTTLLEIVARICDGDHAQFVTGGGRVGEAKRVIPVERFYIRESGILPEKSKKGQGKRRHSEVSEALDNSPGSGTSPSLKLECKEEPVEERTEECTEERTEECTEDPAGKVIGPETAVPYFQPSDDFYSTMTHLVSQMVGSPIPLWTNTSSSSQASKDEVKPEFF